MLRGVFDQFLQRAKGSGSIIFRPPVTGRKFAAGLSWHGEGLHLIVSFGVGDAEGWLTTVSAADVRRAIEPAQNLAAAMA